MSDQDKRNKEANQAEHLMQLFQEVANHSPDEASNGAKEVEKLADAPEDPSYIELDMLNLPPRREVHGKRKNRYAFSLNNPFSRLLIVIIFVIILISLILYFDLLNKPLAIFYIDQIKHMMQEANSMVNQKVI